jgi:hypothetical protein
VAYLNPAVALGARSWVWGSYVVGPLLGAVVGTNLYALLFAGTAPLAEEATVSGSAAQPSVAAKAAKPARRKSTRRK